MPPFRNVYGGRAGPRAVGILVPPGSRTVVTIRPRALSVDLVLLRRLADRTVTGLFEASRQAAGIQAQALAKALVDGAAEGSGQVRLVRLQEGFHVQAEIGPFLLVACPRIPGQPYRPKVYADQGVAEQEADALGPFLFPGADGQQELYTNLSQFGRSERRP